MLWAPSVADASTRRVTTSANGLDPNEIGDESQGATGGTGGLDIRVGKTVEVTSSHRKCWYPTIHQFRSGEILVTMLMSPDEINPEGDFSAYCVSRDGGMTWSQRYTMGGGATADGAWSEVPNHDDNVWHLDGYPEPYSNGNTHEFYDALTKFADGGRYICLDRDMVLKLSQPAYMSPTRLFDRHVQDATVATQFRGRPWGSIIEGPHGELFCSAYYIAEADARRYGKPQYFRDVLLRSTDSGRTWLEYSTIAAVPKNNKPPWMGSEGPNECSIARLADGRIYAVYRTGGDGMIGNAWSSDDGKTWTAPASIGFQGIAPRIHRLKNNMLAMSTGRPGPVVVWFNLDGNGEKWSHATTLFTGMSTRYTDLREIQPGKLLVVYDSVPYGWYDIPYADPKSMNAIYGTFIEVRREQI